MDEIDLRILSCLKENSRIKASAIAVHINLSVTAVIERIRKLEASGIIQQYTTVIDPRKLGKDLTAFISVSLENPKYSNEFIEKMNLFGDILECHYITGDYDFLLKVVTGGSNELEQVLNYIKSAPGVSVTRTLVVLSTSKSEISVAPRDYTA
ncbi:MAG TPA: Lrp/AsnC family transcriptional regulator [Clostridiales bacterium]|nr:Lrp/AsnC family transcriptional regulator [Clostridiales bacterium]HCG36576.1 Lrp/AsnC family transcriptional regulator [Clostridiales bacterium]